MLQVLQNLRDGKLELADVPAPALARGFALVETRASAISVGTERAARDLARMSLLGKARARPDLVRDVVAKVARDGIASTVSAVMTRLESSQPLGYSCAGVVIDADAASGLSVGDRVACAGAGYANHAEICCVPKHLLARIPEGVSDEDAAFTTLGAVAMQGVRAAAPALGECVVVIGLGVIGLLAVQMLVAAGARAIGVDLEAGRCALAIKLGAVAALEPGDGVAGAVQSITGGIGADAILVAASSSGSEPLELAGEVARHRARVVLVGATGMEIPRRAYYDKELSVMLSTSYGPGRYDPSYEERGHDYPVGHVRWTEQRNMTEVLRLMAERRLVIGDLRARSFPIQRALEAYSAITEPAGERPIGVVLTYPSREGKRGVVRQLAAVKPSRSRRIGVALVGAGTYARGVLMPELAKLDGAEVRCVVSRGGQSAADLARRFGVARATSDVEAVLADGDIDAVVIATRHDSHASLAIRALAAGKHVLVEKPPATRLEDLDALRSAWVAAERALFTGYNRDFAPATRALIDAIGPRRPVQIVIRCNAGPVPPSSWTLDEVEGGGRWLGEGCHFVSLAATLAGSTPDVVSAVAARGAGEARDPSENIAVQIGFVDGSTASIVYTSLGDRAFEKERVEVFAGGVAASIEDFVRHTIVLSGRRSSKRYLSRDKGQRAMLEAFVEACRGALSAGVTDRMLEATRATILAASSMTSGRPLRLSEASAPTRDGEEVGPRRAE